jgi:hypothetical protein
MESFWESDIPDASGSVLLTRVELLWVTLLSLLYFPLRMNKIFIYDAKKVCQG